MKKIILITIVPICIIIFLTGCTYKGYSGKYPDLYTVAINSVLWNNGHSFGADRYINSQIEIIDKDTYGRTIFIYHEKYYAGADISFSSLIVCQNSNEKNVFYYEDVNYIVKEQAIYTKNTVEFEKEEIEQLKLINDWNQEINFDKCIKKEIVKRKQNIPYENEVKSKIISEFHLINGKYNLFTNFLTNDSDNSKFIMYGCIREKNSYTYFIGLVNILEEIEIKFLIPTNLFDYKKELITFKKTNGWT